MNKKLILVVLIIFILTSIPLTVYLVKKRQEIRSRAAPATTLSVAPPGSPPSVDDIFNVNIQINTGINQALGADLLISFNKNVLECLAIGPGDFFDNPAVIRNEIDNQTGTIRFAFGQFSGGKSGTGILATISFKAISDGISPIDFLTGTSVQGAAEAEILQTAINGSVTVVIPPTPTPKPARLNCRVRFQGINDDKGGKKVKITLRPTSGADQVDDDFDVVHEADGIYSGTLHNLDPGIYTVLVKGWAHLQKNLGDIELIAGQTAVKDGSGEALITGDADNDNKVNMLDFRILSLSFDQTGENLPADFDSNNIVNMLDFRFISLNFDFEGDN